VLRHELAHAAVWFLNGGGVGRLRFTRLAGGTLEASVLIGERVADQNIDDKYTDSAAERLLAGEIASRRWLGLPQDRVSVEGCSFPVSNGTPVMRVLQLCRDRREDIARVLVLAGQRHAVTWCDWLSERLGRAREQVRLTWPAIESCARSYTPLLPRSPGYSRIIWGTDLLADLWKCGLRPLDADKPPVELLKVGESGSPFTCLRRWWRACGRNATPWRYRTAAGKDDRFMARRCGRKRFAAS
jgi:hypothetical protein